MKRSNGFTLIELLVTITIMVILMTLAVVNLRSTQANARDAEIKTKTETIARGLELYYKNGDPAHNIAAGHYPSINEWFYADGWDKPEVGPQIIGGYFEKSFLPGVTKNSMYVSGRSDRALGLLDFWGKSVEDPANIEAFVPTHSIVYEPILYKDKADFYGPPGWFFCPDQTCRRFNLYYRTELDGVIHTIKSQNQ